MEDFDSNKLDNETFKHLAISQLIVTWILPIPFATLLSIFFILKFPPEFDTFGIAVGHIVIIVLGVALAYAIMLYINMVIFVAVSTEIYSGAEIKKR